MIIFQRVTFSFLAISLVILSACGGGGGGSSSTTAQALQVVEKVSVVDADESSTSSLVQALASSDIPAGSAFFTDPQFLYVNERSAEAFNIINEILCSIEVRSRATSRFGTPEESIDVRKQRRLVRGARTVLARGGLPHYRAVRFDVVAIETDHTPPIIRLTRNAFYLP